MRCAASSPCPSSPSSPPPPPTAPADVPSSSALSAAPLPSCSSVLFPSAVAFPTSVAVAANQHSLSKNRPGIVQCEAQSQQRLRSFEAVLRNRSADHLPHGRFIAIPPTENGQREGQKEGQKTQNSAEKSERGEGMALIVQQKVFENYHLVAYSLVIVTYLLAFCEYLYLRLLSLIFPEPLVYRRNCEKHHFEAVIRNEVHFASGCAVFLVMSVYQLVCFFLLVVSSRFMEVKRTYSHVESIEQRLRHELIFAVQRTMFVTLFPTFAIYMLCSAVILCSIFYMVGLRDPIAHMGSRVLIYLFDLFVVLYLLAFPVLCVLFHPDIDCCARFVRFFCWRSRKRASAAQPPKNDGNKSLKSVTEVTEQTGANLTNGDGTNDEFLNATGRHTKNEKCIKSGKTFPIGGPSHSVPAQLEKMAPKDNELGAEGGRERSERLPMPKKQQSMAQLGASVANYGSLDRRGPWATILARNFETESATLPAGTNVCLKTIRQRRRGDKYRRLRGGSDESADWRQNTTNGAKTELDTAAKTDGGAEEKTEERRARDERRHTEKHAAPQKDAWDEGGTVSC